LTSLGSFFNANDNGFGMAGCLITVRGRKVKGRKSAPDPAWGWLSLLLACALVLPAAPAPAQEQRTYLSPKYGFNFQYPAAYELKVSADSYFDFISNGKTMFALRVEDRFIELLYQMLRPGPVVSRVGEDPYRELAQETRKAPELFRRYARREAQNWCSADGPDGSVYCERINREQQVTSRGGFRCLEFYLIMTREDFTKNTRQQRQVGPVLAVLVPKDNRPLLLMISPPPGQAATPQLTGEMRRLVGSLGPGP